VFISDQEEALKSAVRELLPAVPQLLCVWHINKNVLTKAQHVWRDADGETEEEKQAIKEKRAQFMAAWNKVRTLV
jgi:MULE transposase domain